MELGLLGLLIVGALAGWLATNVMKKEGFGLWGNLVVGVVGALVGGWLFRLLGFYTYGWIASLIVAFIGALILLYVLDFIKQKR